MTDYLDRMVAARKTRERNDAARLNNGYPTRDDGAAIPDPNGEDAEIRTAPRTLTAEPEAVWATQPKPHVRSRRGVPLTPGADEDLSRTGWSRNPIIDGDRCVFDTATKSR